MRTAMLLALLASGCLDGGRSPDPVPTPLDPDPVLDDPPALEPPSSDLANQALLAFSGCLTFEDFQAANMGATWRSLESSDGACTSCHSYGEFGFVTGLDDQVFFEAITTDRYYLMQFFTLEPAPAGGFQVIVATQSLTRVSTRVAPHQQHPAFEVSPGLAALNAWHALALARQQAGTCGMPTLEN